MVTLRRVVRVILTLIVCALLVVLLIVPNVSFVGAKCVLCTDQSGKSFYLSYSEAYERLESVTEKGVLLTGGVSVSGSKALQGVLQTLATGELAELLAMDTDGLTDLERAAIFRTWGNTLFYDGDSFAWNGTGVARTSDTKFLRAILLGGDFPKGFLADAGVCELTVGANAEPTAKGLLNSEVVRLHARAPYFAEGGCLYLTRMGAVRLIAVLPCREAVIGEADYFDAGALDACPQLSSLTVSSLKGSVRALFSDGVPETLQQIRILGGAVENYALLGCGSVEEVNACGAKAETEAFVGCSGLKTLHTENGSVRLTGDFERTRAACGCYIFTRKG